MAGLLDLFQLNYNPCCPNCGDDSFEWVDDGVVECISCNTQWDTGLTYEELFDEDSEAGCDACDNPHYPECKASCPMFDY